ncbi:MAG TPA: alcohol dehydrogenase, partial [bacterium (Candidatus Stahlbacteria)]|nr:alcohol dehydrogenase [Candidatus Stahlbacteria bacterium]
MKVGVYYSNNDIRVEERAVPDIGPDEVLLRIKACGICGSDVMEWYRIKKAPRILGHEATGKIVKIGPRVKDWKIGDRVFISHHVPCYECQYCQAGHHTLCDTLRRTNIDPGGFAEYARVPGINVRSGLFRLPDETSYDLGTFIEPLGCVLRGQRLVRMKAGELVLILGSGISGQLHIRMAKLKNCQVIATDINAYRKELAEISGADLVLDAQEDICAKSKEHFGRLPDLVVVSTGAEKAIEQAFFAADRGGRILFFAPTAPDVRVPMPLFDLYFNGNEIYFSYAAVRDDLNQAIEI